MQEYVVQRGDTLYGISSQFGVSVQDIKSINNLNNNVIYVGQVLRIPTTGTSILYVVKRGDTLYSISRKYGVSVESIMKTNNLNNNNLYIGQELVIPILGNENENYILYTVKYGDTLYSIARNFSTTVLEIKRINNLTSDNLSVGQQLKVPSGSGGDNNIDNGYVIPIGASCYGSGYVGSSYITYTVKAGDNLYSISRKYGVSVDSIIELNNLKSTNLSIGQVLKIKEV